MRLPLLGCWFFCLLAVKVQSRPQITKLLPIEELPEEEEQQQQRPHVPMMNDVKPLDKLLGKLRATYNFVFRKPENTSNVEKILAKDAPSPDLEALKTIWAMQGNRAKPENKTNIGRLYESPFSNEKRLMINAQDWQNDLPPLDDLEPLGPLEVNEERDVEFVTPGTGLQLPVSISRQLVEWLGSLLGLTYGVYTKLARAIHHVPNNTPE